MDARTIEPPPREAVVDLGRLRDIILVRIATDDTELARAALVKELGPVAAGRLSASEWKTAVDRNLGALADAGLVALKTLTVSPTDPGRNRAAMVLGGRGALPKSWREARDVRLMAKALGVETEPAARLKLLAKPEGLRMAIVQKAFGIRLRGAPTPTRIRSALAVIALDRAFAGKGASGQSKTGLSAKDGRKLASQLSTTQRSFGTDSRLIAALAAEHVGAEGNDLAALQLAVLGRYVGPGGLAACPLPAAKGAKRRKPAAPAHGRVPQVSAAAGLALLQQALGQPFVGGETPTRLADALSTRPDIARFAAEVRARAEPLAEGWPGNRKAWISRVWRAVAHACPHWELSEIEFKAMLTEAHRAGQLVLANADLKDTESLHDVQASQIAYRNAVFHYIRVDE